MKKGILMIVLVFGSLSASAMSGKGAPPNDGSGRTQCAWYDSGSKEEHSPHTSQQACLASGHSSCDQLCFVYDQVCEVVGVTIKDIFDSNGKCIDHKEELTTFKGTDRDLYRAREEARYQCERAYPRQRDCRPTSCHEESRRVN